ncbi:hypothetical protein F2Q68_00011753 [Brassica cretica]|uniref:Uncharacterized protein n=1 Tax=Brassica cretica TaxID=69181 RepID=A0A8S9KQL6_BRACR|nr:hypothetical protein F2Q68_00011753 [Brassica cretica]
MRLKRRFCSSLWLLHSTARFCGGGSPLRRRLSVGESIRRRKATSLPSVERLFLSLSLSSLLVSRGGGSRGRRQTCLSVAHRNSKSKAIDVLLKFVISKILLVLFLINYACLLICLSVRLCLSWSSSTATDISISVPLLQSKAKGCDSCSIMSLAEMDGTNGSKLICSLCLKLQLTKFIEQGVEDSTVINGLEKEQCIGLVRMEWKVINVMIKSHIGLVVGDQCIVHFLQSIINIFPSPPSSKHFNS